MLLAACNYLWHGLFCDNMPLRETTLSLTHARTWHSGDVVGGHMTVSGDPHHQHGVPPSESTSGGRVGGGHGWPDYGPACSVAWTALDERVAATRSTSEKVERALRGPCAVGPWPQASMSVARHRRMMRGCWRSGAAQLTRPQSTEAARSFSVHPRNVRLTLLSTLCARRIKTPALFHL